MLIVVDEFMCDRAVHCHTGTELCPLSLLPVITFTGDCTSDIFTLVRARARCAVTRAMIESVSG